MWRSRARALLLLRSSTPRPSPTPPPPKTLTLAPTLSPWLLRFLSSSPQPLDEGESTTSTSASAEPSGHFSGDGKGAAVADGDSLGSLWEESVGAGAGDADAIFTSEEAEAAASDEEVSRVRHVVESAPEDQIEAVLDAMVVDFAEPLLARVIQESNCSGKKIVYLFKFACKNNSSAKSLRNLELVASKISDSGGTDKLEAYMLWDLIKEMGSAEGLVNTGILNRVIVMFWKLGKAKAALEVFDKFDELGCSRDGDTFYFTIEALGKRSMIDAAWHVCEKMLSSVSFPDGKKVGEIITFFCKGKKVNEAYLVYLSAKEKKISIPTAALDFLIGALARSDETVSVALELLGEYQGDSLKYASRSFASVVHGLCKSNNVNEAKKLLMRMVNLGPAPGSAAFNFVITALSKAGEMEDAKGLMRVMESRGLRPDVYTYSVIMSGYTKGGMMDEAHELLRKAKKNHPKLSRVTYHILIRGYCKMEEFEKALGCLKEMKEDGLQPNTDEYNKLIQSLCLKAVDWRTAEKLLKEMEEDGLCLKGITRSLIAAVKKLEEEEIQSNTSLEA